MFRKGRQKNFLGPWQNPGTYLGIRKLKISLLAANGINLSRGKNVDISALHQALVRRDRGQIECLCSGGDETVRGVAMRKIDGRAHQHPIHREGKF